MTTVELITALFYEVDEQLHTIPQHPEARRVKILERALAPAVMQRKLFLQYR